MVRSRIPALMPRLAGVALFALSGAAAVAQSIEIIELRNRPATQILPVVAPLLAAGGSVTGSGFRLFVRTGADNLEEIRQVVATLDRAPRQLMISVRQDSGAASAAGAPGSNRAGAYDGTGTAQDNVLQRLRVEEGNAAYISAGTGTLVPQGAVAGVVNGVLVERPAPARDLNTGFQVTPRVNGDQVLLDIATQRDAPAAAPGHPGAGMARGAASLGRTASTVGGRLGEWIELSGQTRSQSAATRGVLARSSDAGARERRVWIMVEEVR